MSTEQLESNSATGPAKRRQLIVGGVVLVCLALAVLLLLRPFSSSGTVQATTSADVYTIDFDGDEFSGGEGAAPSVKTKPAVARDSEEKYASACASCAKKHQLAAMPVASTTTRVAPGAPSEAELKKALKDRNMGQKVNRGDTVKLGENGIADPPISAPGEVQGVVAAANAINNYPYIWGGGHASFQARGYDCSGSVSYALKGADLVGRPMTSGEFMDWGDSGPGKWITVYANEGHMFMVVAGVRYDTSFRDGPYGSRWQTAKRSYSGFTVRHPPGL
jgi:cytochrome c553